MDKQKQRQFEDRHLLVMFMNCLLLLVGGCCLLMGGMFVIAAQGGLLYGPLLILFGSFTVFTGVNGIKIAGRKPHIYPLEHIMSCQREYVRLLYWYCLLAGFVFSVLAFGMAVTEDPWCMVWILLATMHLLGFLKQYKGYRSFCILGQENQVYGMYASGKAFRFSISEVGNIRQLSKTYGTLVRYVVYDYEGRKLLSFHNRLKGGKQVLDVLCGERYGCCWIADDYQALQKKIARQWDEAEEKIGRTWQHDSVGKIRKGYYVLVITNILITVFLLLLCSNDWISGKYRLFIIEIQPVCYLIYLWVFRDVVVLGYNRFVSKEWKENHISLDLGYMHIFFIFLFLTAGYFSKEINLIEGAERVYIAGGLCAVLLWGITALRLRRRPIMVLWLVWAGFIVLIMTIGICQASLYAISKPVKHYPAQVIDTRASLGRHNYYYATVKLEGIGEKELNIFKSDYEEIQNGVKKVICEREAPGGIKMVLLHDE